MARLGILVALAALIPARPAGACDPATPTPHTVDPAQVGVDQTPPQLVEPAVAELRNFDDDSNGCASKCGVGWYHGARLINLGTDDMTPADRLGYRVTLVAGEAPGLSTDGSPILGAANGSLTVFWNGDDDFDFTLQLIAVDAAGNESVPKTVRVSDGGGCSVGPRGSSRGVDIAMLALALLSAGARARGGGSRAYLRSLS